VWPLSWLFTPLSKKEVEVEKEKEIMGKKIIKSVTELAQRIAKIEGKKKELSLPQIREVIAIVSDLSQSNPEIFALLTKNGERRLKRKASK